jgi:hypothetical protein
MSCWYEAMATDVPTFSADTCSRLFPSLAILYKASSLNPLFIYIPICFSMKQKYPYYSDSKVAMAQGFPWNSLLCHGVI